MIRSTIVIFYIHFFRVAKQIWIDILLPKYAIGVVLYKLY